MTALNNVTFNLDDLNTMHNMICHMIYTHYAVSLCYYQVAVCIATRHNHTLQNFLGGSFCVLIEKWLFTGKLSW